MIYEILFSDVTNFFIFFFLKEIENVDFVYLQDSKNYHFFYCIYMGMVKIKNNRNINKIVLWIKIHLNIYLIFFNNRF